MAGRARWQHRLPDVTAGVWLCNMKTTGAEQARTSTSAPFGIMEKNTASAQSCHESGFEEMSSQLRSWLATKQQQKRLQIGVSFRHLDCNGLCTPSQSQLTFLSALAKPFYALRARGLQQKPRIMHQIEGLVMPGEMLLVLGRPGSGCSTFLKTLSGDLRGLQIEPTSVITYQGQYPDRLGFVD